MSNKLDIDFARNGVQFTLDLFQQLAINNGLKENFVFSPLSIQCCLSLAFAGSTGQTAEQLVKGLKLVSSNAEEVAQSFNNVLKMYAQSDLLKIGNKIYVQEDCTLNADYKRTVTEKYHAEAENIDFSKSVEAAKNINEWISARTAGKITELISADSLNSMTKLVLLNAMHFKGQWSKKFNESQTAEDDFFVDDENVAKVTYMNQKGKFNFGYFEDLDCSALEMSYKNSDLSMLIFLPNSNTGLPELAEKLQNTNMLELVKDMSIEEIIVKFPKFKIDFDIELKDVLQKLGINKIFESGAEFNNMLQSKADLHASKIVHKATIEVNEEGTEAAAATGMIMMMRSILLPMEFNADHPFLYFIWNKRNILFAGAFVNAPIK